MLPVRSHRLAAVLVGGLALMLGYFCLQALALTGLLSSNGGGDLGAVFAIGGWILFVIAVALLGLALAIWKAAPLGLLIGLVLGVASAGLAASSALDLMGRGFGVGSGEVLSRLALAAVLVTIAALLASPTVQWARSAVSSRDLPQP